MCTLLKTVAYVPEWKKIRKNVFGQLISLQLWKLTRENLDFTGKKFGWEVETKFYVSRGTLREYCFWKKVLNVSGFSDEYWRFLDSDEQFSSRLTKLKKRSEEQFKENPFSSVKASFLGLWVNCFLTFSGKVHQSCQNCNLRGLGRFWVKTLIEVSDIVSNFFGIWAKLLGVLFKKNFQVCHNCHPGVQRSILRKIISFPRKFLFFVSNLELQRLFCCLANKNM